MKKIFIILLLVISLSLVGCSSAVDTINKGSMAMSDDIFSKETPVEKPFDIMYGNFVGLNYYDYGIPKTYVVVLIDGKEYETIGYENNYWVMNERVIVIKVNGEYYSIPLREKNQ